MEHSMRWFYYVAFFVVLFSGCSGEGTSLLVVGLPQTRDVLTATASPARSMKNGILVVEPDAPVTVSFHAVSERQLRLELTGENVEGTIRASCGNGVVFEAPMGDGGPIHGVMTYTVPERIDVDSITISLSDSSVTVRSIRFGSFPIHTVLREPVVRDARLVVVQDIPSRQWIVSTAVSGQEEREGKGFLTFSYRLKDDVNDEVPETPVARVTVSNREQYEMKILPGGGRQSVPVDSTGTLTIELDETTFPRFIVEEAEFAALDDEESNPVDFGLLPVMDAVGWIQADHQFYQWSLNHRVFVLDTIDYERQASYFKRLAFFLEKPGFVGRIPTLEEIVHRHGWNAHDYDARNLALFFDFADTNAVPLTDSELALRDFCREESLVVYDGERWRPGTGALLGISQESGPALRKTLLTHETMHGIFASRPVYTEAIFTYWSENVDDAAKAIWRGLLSRLTYNSADEYLMVNEFQAYLMQQPLNQVTRYFEAHMADRIEAIDPFFAEEYRRFVREHPGFFLDAARHIDSFLYTASGMHAGDVSGLHRLL